MSKVANFGKLLLINIVALLISRLANSEFVSQLDARLVLVVTLVLIGVSAVIESSTPTTSGKPTSWRWLKDWLQIAVVGLILGLGIHYLWKGQWILGVAFLVLIPFPLLLPIIVRFINTLRQKIKERLKPQLDKKIDSLAGNVVTKVEEIEFKSEYYQSLIYTCRDYQTQGLDKDRILKLEKVFVPLKIVSKEVVQVDSKMIQEVEHKIENPKEKQIWHFLAAMSRYPAFRRMAVLGAPGSGKTTLLRHLTLTYATKQERKLHPQAPKLIPVLLYLRDVRQMIAQKKPPLAELITEQVKRQRKLQPLNPPFNWFAEKLSQRECLVMLDGLDEVADEIERQQVSLWVNEQMETYPGTPFILTSRPFGYQSALLQQGVTVLEVQPFNLKQVKQFIHSWYLQTEVMSRAGEEDLGVREEAKQQADDLIERVRKSSPLAAMAVNPLLLTMIATVHRRGNALPGKRVELYKEICQVLLEKRLRAKKIDEPLSATQKQSVLQVLALALMQKKTREFALLEGVFLIQGKLAEVAGAANSQKFFEQIKDVSGLLVEKELGVYEFAHLSFQEYLAAVQLKETNHEKLLIGNINNPWWAETIRLYASQTNASSLIRTVLALPSPSVEALALAYDCLEEGLSVYPEVKRQLDERMEADLGKLMTEGFQLAANVLLSRRLKNLVRIEENVEIDLSYITYAEYQLFIDDKRQAGKNRQPDHWQNYRFPPGDAQKPITGIRASDAEEFCEWLTQQQSALGFRYRLPTLEEAEENPATEQQIGCWCNDEGRKVIVGVEATQLQNWHSNLTGVIILKGVFKRNNLKRNFNFVLNSDFNQVLNRNLNRSLNYVLKRNLKRVLNHNFNRVLNHNFNRVLNEILNNDLNPNLNRNLNQVLNNNLNRDLNYVLSLDFYGKLNRKFNLDLYGKLNRELNRDLNHVLYERIEANEASDFLILYFPLLCLIVIYHVLLVAYKAASQNKEVLKQINLSHQKSETIGRKYQQKIDAIYPLYVYLVLQDERLAGRIPAWEGIRIVRESE
ncbi:MAG: NACHT domain-containing protein [Symploca sp. SIO1B1]|nr:NACHT domain-containing protein [Symploca sp. SIO1B1]